MNSTVVIRDTSQLQSTARMFLHAWAFSSSLVLTGTSNVSDMSEMFSGARAKR
jgi:hypothetical protein